MLQKLVSTDGAVVWAGEFDAYGNCTVTVETVNNPLRLPGQYFDAETGLYYNVQRYYDPHTGRYVQTDPAEDGLNPYAYVGGNPVNAIDPLGLCALRMVGGVADFAAGIGLIGGALSGPPGWVAIGVGVIGGLTMLNGVDNLLAGADSAISGQYQQSFGEAAIHQYVQNDRDADLLYMGSQLLLGYAGIRADRALQTARAAQSIPDGNGYKLGLGRTQHPAHERSGLLDRFIAHLDDPEVMDYWQIIEKKGLPNAMVGAQLEGQLLAFMGEAKQIYMNLDGVVSSLNRASLQEALELGADGTTFFGNITRWEFLQVWTTYRGKATFYFGGKARDLSQFLH